MFIGTATTILEWEGIRLMTDPNFLHKGDYVQKGPGAITRRMTDPAGIAVTLIAGVLRVCKCERRLGGKSIGLR